MSVRSMKAYIWLINILILVGILGIGYLFFTKSMSSAENYDGDLRKIVNAAEKESVGPAMVKRTMNEYNALVRSPFFLHAEAGSGPTNGATHAGHRTADHIGRS